MYNCTNGTTTKATGIIDKLCNLTGWGRADQRIGNNAWVFPFSKQQGGKDV